MPRTAGKAFGATPPDDGPGLRAQYVLVVQNDGGARELSQEVLTRCSIDFIAVDSGVAAVEVARGRPPAAVLLDFQLRDVSGIESIEWFRANPALQGTPLILFVMSDRDAALGQRHGADCVLRTPTAAAIEKAVLRMIRTGAQPPAIEATAPPRRRLRKR
jgi:CheY-like chemotaxis protein